MTPIKPQIYFC